MGAVRNFARIIGRQRILDLVLYPARTDQGYDGFPDRFLARIIRDHLERYSNRYGAYVGRHDGKDRKHAVAGHGKRIKDKKHS